MGSAAGLGPATADNDAVVDDDRVGDSIAVGISSVFDKSRDALYISNYANIQIKDVLTRVDGVGSITVFGSRDYAMQIWLDPNRLQSLGLTATE